MAARTPTRRRLSSSIAAIEKNSGSNDPRLGDLRRLLHDARAEDELRAAITALQPDAPEVVEAVITLIRSGRRRHEAVPAA